MMRAINKEIKQSSSIHQKIRTAAFIGYEDSKKEIFIYSYIHRISKKLQVVSTTWKRLFNSIIQKPARWIAEIDWEVVNEDLGMWLFSIIIEGFTANIATHYLIGVPFTLGTIFAHGIMINQGISIYWRLRRDGQTTKIPKKNQRDSEF